MNDEVLDLASRRPVWEALAALWLDTELTDGELDHIAGVLAASPYSLPEMRAIHDYEVAPVLWVNLVTVVGEWAGFDNDWLAERCHSHAQRRGSRCYRLRIGLQRPLFRFFVDADWRRLVLRVEARLRAGQGVAADTRTDGG